MAIEDSGQISFRSIIWTCLFLCCYSLVISVSAKVLLSKTSTGSKIWDSPEFISAQNSLGSTTKQYQTYREDIFPSKEFSVLVMRLFIHNVASRGFNFSEIMDEQFQIHIRFLIKQNDKNEPRKIKLLYVFHNPRFSVDASSNGFLYVVYALKVARISDETIAQLLKSFVQSGYLNEVSGTNVELLYNKIEIERNDSYILNRNSSVLLMLTQTFPVISNLHYRTDVMVYYLNGLNGTLISTEEFKGLIDLMKLEIQNALQQTSPVSNVYLTDIEAGPTGGLFITLALPVPMKASPEVEKIISSLFDYNTTKKNSIFHQTDSKVVYILFFQSNGSLVPLNAENSISIILPGLVIVIVLLSVFSIGLLVSLGYFKFKQRKALATNKASVLPVKDICRNFGLPIAEPISAVTVEEMIDTDTTSEIPKLTSVFESENFLIPLEDLTFVECIGSGAHSFVYRGTWKSTSTEVAIKKMHIFPSDFDQVMEEGKLMARLRHPNIIQFLGVAINKNLVCLVLEFMPRGSLFSVIHSSKDGKAESLDIPTRIFMLIGAARGLMYLHQCNPPVIHRDFKSLNLLVSNDYTVKVSDFGLSVLKMKSHISSGNFGGTPGWCAPEVLRNERYDEKADIYSFAVVIWEVLSNQIPFEELSPLETAMVVGVENQHPDIARIGNDPNDAFDIGIKNILNLCWKSDVSQRPDAKEVVDLLERNRSLLIKNDNRKKNRARPRLALLSLPGQNSLASNLQDDRE